MRFNRNPLIFQSIGKLYSDSVGKLWESTNIPRVWVSYIFNVKQKSMVFQNERMSEFFFYRINMGKHNSIS